MAESYKILGQSAPAASTPTTLYTVPTGTETVISTIMICNRGSSVAQVRLWFAPDGAGDSNEQYVLYDHRILGNDFVSLTIGVTIDAADLIRVQADTANVSFTAFGVEVS